MPLYNPAFVVGGTNATVYPARFVKITGEFAVEQATAGDGVIGVAQEGTWAPPGITELLGATSSTYAAKTGQTLKVFGLGDICVVEVAASTTVNAGAFVKSDADGRAVSTSTAGDKVGGIALQTVTSTSTEYAKLLIQVNPHTI
ncbi:MAG: hypothetical protein ACO3F3_09285 [Gemmataceae bacterium]|jgi:hypothetical protein